ALSFIGFSRDECRRHRDLSGHPCERDAELRDQPDADAGGTLRDLGLLRARDTDRSRTSTIMSEGKKKIALSGVAAGETSICTVGKEGAGLTYRGYSIEDLAEHATYEEVTWLVLHGELP